MANVFISHRTNDNREAELLANEMRKAGHNVWLDIWNITLGHSIVERINEGLEQANYLILCYSSSGIDSEWMRREWMSGLSRKLNGKQINILPVILTGGEPPAILEDVLYVDLTKNWSDGVVSLLRAIV
ncbi:MAG TPA: toll/interleukin-1 receptor domain-containing protein [Pyrinomonadaceae bacterium]|jgi:hypothetical protein|nr:toll/interleukin-1 receptor domain-containing protein [Pyrinomonadaceae bacterium]